MKLDEINILTSLKNGDEDIYIYLFRKYYIALCAFSRKYVGRKDIAEEIVSETFSISGKITKTLQINISIKAYLFQAVANNSLNYLRKKEKEKSLEEYFNNSSSENIEIHGKSVDTTIQNLLTDDLYSQIYKAIDRLPNQQQKVFKLKRSAGKKNKEVAEVMGLSIKTVEMHLYNAMFNLRKMLKDYLPLLMGAILYLE